MRKQVQKERCTKIMLTKCKAVCCLYNKVQLAAAKMLDAEPAIFQFECNVPMAAAYLCCRFFLICLLSFTIFTCFSLLIVFPLNQDEFIHQYLFFTTISLDYH